MKLKVLAEAIILQSLEDLWDEKHRCESINFFTGKEFPQVAKMAGLNTDDKLKILNMVKEVGFILNKSKVNSADRANPSPQALSASHRSSTYHA